MVIIPPPIQKKGDLVEFTDDGTLRLNFHEAQTLIWDSKKRFVFFIAGTQVGKTSFVPWWLWREITWCGSGDYLAVTATFDLFKLKMLPEMRNVFEHILGIGRYWSGDKILELKNPETGKFHAQRADDPMWARIILRSAHAKGGLESSTAKGAVLDECGHDDFTLGAWEAVIRRLSLARGRVLGTTTPYNLGWLKQEIVDTWEAGDKNIDVINAPSIINPNFPIEEFEEAKARLADWKFRMMYEGLFTRPAGMIYKDFINEYREEGGHKVRPFDLPTDWPRYIAVDPGAVNMAILWFAHDTEHDIYYLYREKLGGEMSTGEHARDALTISSEHNERIINWYIGNKSEVQQRLDFKAAGVMGVKSPPIADVEPGIDRVIALLRQFRLYIFDTCRGTLDQMGTYRRKRDKNDEIIEAIHNKEQYHYLDALRYFAVGREKGKTGDIVVLRRGK